MISICPVTKSIAIYLIFPLLSIQENKPPFKNFVNKGKPLDHEMTETVRRQHGS